MNSRISKIVALVLIQCQLSMMLPAEELRTDLRRGLARLEHYLDRAAAERRTQDWEQLARAGLEAAMYEWESGALWLLEQDGEAWREERRRAELDYRRETESAYVRWAGGRVFTERAGFEASELGAQLREAAAAWSYGNSGRIVNPADAEKARIAWEQRAGEIVDRYLEAWEERQGLAYTELEGRLRDLGLSDAERQALIRGVAEERRAMLNLEYGRVALAEGNRLMAELLYDQGSTKKIAGDEAASVIARELAQEAETASEKRTRDLFAELDLMFSAEEEAGIELNAADWLNQFRSAFEEGLARWEEAELGFLAARAEWEHDAEDAYLAGEETWNRAYLELTGRQKAWETAILAKLDDGFAKWQENQSRLNTEIEIARKEFIAASEESRKIKEKMMDSQAEIYVRSRQMMDIVSQGLEGWYELWDEKYLAVYTMIKQASAMENIIWHVTPEQERRPEEQNMANQFKDLDENIYKSLLNDNINIDELTAPGNDNIDILRNQIELLQEACRVMRERNWGLPLSIDELVSSAGDLFDEERGWFSLARRYREYAGTSAERLYQLSGSTGEGIEGYVGEAQTELLKARALLGYWDDELEVAEALNQYAQETGSIIEDEARTRRELESAKLAYEKSVKNYERAIELARAKGSILDRARENFEEARIALAGLGTAVEEAQRDYTNVLLAIQKMNSAPVYNELANLALAILDIWEGKTESGDEGAKTIEESILDYYRLSLEYADILRSLEINSLLKSLETGAGPGRSGIDDLSAAAEEARTLARSNQEEDLRSAAGLYPAGLAVSIRWGEGETLPFQNGGDLIIALSEAYRNSAVPEEREALLALAQQVWEEASLWYEEEILLQKQSIEYLKTGTLPGAEKAAEAELRVQLAGLLAALRTTLVLGVPDGGSGPGPDELEDLAAALENILSLGPGEMAGAVEEAAAGNPLFADAMKGLLVLPDGAYAAAWLAQRQAKRDLGLFELERAQLIEDRYGGYEAKNINKLNREARESVERLIAGFNAGNRNTAGRAGALGYAAELRRKGQGLNQPGQEALNAYITAFLEYAAVRDCRDNPAAGADLSSLLRAYEKSMAGYEAYSSWRYKIYDEAGLAAIAGSGEFSMLGSDDRNKFFSYVSSSAYAELAAWAGKIINAAYNDCMNKADALAYEQFYRQEKEDSRFSWTAGFADSRDQMYESGIGGETLEKIDPLFTGGAADMVLGGLKNKTIWAGVWFTGEDEWNYSQYRANAGEAGAELARDALEKGWDAYQKGLTMDTALYAMVKADLDRILYANKSIEELNSLKDEKKAALDTALEAYNTYLDNDYDLAVKALDQDCGDYNAAVDEADRRYKEMTGARLHLRKRQEIYDWASSVYLKGFGTNFEENYLTPLEKLSQIRYARERAAIAVEVLNEILGIDSPAAGDSRHDAAMELYKESRRKHYLAQAAAYEGGLALGRQQAVVREAELAEEAARRKLVTNTGSVAPSAYELVNLAVDENGAYRIELAYTLKEIYFSDIIGSHDPDRSSGYGPVVGNEAQRKAGVEQDSEIFSRYFNDDKAVPVERVEAKEYMSAAEYEAGEWLKRMGVLGVGYYDDVMLASLYVRFCAAGGSAEGNEWFSGINDPRPGGTYALGDIPLDFSVRGLDLRGEYDSARRKVLQDTYNRVMAGEGGEEDIARYLLYRNRNIIGNAASYEEDLLKARAVEILDRAIGETSRNYGIAHKTAMGLGAGFTATGAGLLATAWLNPGNVALAKIAFTAAAAAFVTAEILDHTRGQIDSIQDGVRGLAAGLKQNLDGSSGYNTQFINNYRQWEKSLAYLSQERKVLNMMMYGTEEKPPEENESAELDYENFRAGLSALLNSGQAKTAVSYEESIELFTGGLFDASGAKAGSSVGGALNLINAFLDKEAAGRKQTLDAEAERLRAEQEQNIKLYHAAMASMLDIPEDRQAELRALALRAGDFTLDIAERRSAGLEYERLAAELCGKTGDVRELIRKYLWKAFGDGAWDSEWYAASLISLEGELFDSRTIHVRTTEPYTEQEIALLRDSVLAALDRNSALALSAKEWEWNLRREDFLAQFRSWQEQVEQVEQTGIEEWQKAREKMNEGYYVWQKKFGNEYQTRTGAWDANYLEFVNEKQQWIEEQYLYAVNVRNAGLFDYTEADASRIIGEALAQFSVEKLNREVFDPAAYTDMLLGDSILGDLLSRVDSLEGRSEFGSPGVQTAARRTSAAADLAQAAKILDAMNGDMQKAAAKLAVHQAQKLIDEAIQQFWDRLALENKAMLEWEERLVQASGYRTDGEIRRQAIVDSTVSGTITRTQTVHRYRDYVPDSAPAAGVDLNAAVTQDLDADTVLRFVQIAHWNLDKWGETIFGRVDDTGTIIERRIPRGFGELTAAGYAETASAEKGRVDDLSARMNKLEARGFDTLSDDEKKEYESLANQLVTVRDGELGAHIGYGPLLKDEVSYRHSPIDDALDLGAGEMGKIMLDFMWNSRVSTTGYMESFAAVYDQKLWIGDGTIRSPTIRDIASVAGSIASVAVGAALTPAAGSLVGMIDDVIFAGFDLGIGYRDTGEVLQSLAFSAGSSAVSIATAGLGNSEIVKSMGTSVLSSLSDTFGETASAVLYKALGSAASSYANTTAMNAMRAFDLDTGNFDFESFGRSLYSTETLSGTFGAFAGSGFSALAGTSMSFSDQKLYGGLADIAAAGTGEAARYGVYALDSMVNGGGDFMNRLGQAYDNMGGITLNIADLGSLLDFMGTVSYRLGENYDTKLGALGGLFAGTGLLELALERGGASLALGMNGVDVGGGLYSSAKHGLDYAFLKYSNTAVDQQRDLLIANYLKGDWAAENTSMRVGFGSDKLAFVNPGSLGQNVFGETTRKDGSKGRLITIADMGDLNSNAIVLQHEAYRDGYKTSDNEAETIAAVLGHTAMALRMLQAGEDITRNGMLVNDLIAYLGAGGDMAAFARYALENYDSSGDFWKLTKEGNLEYDGFATLRDADGNIIKSYSSMGLKSDSAIEGALLHILGISPKDSDKVAAVRKLMVNSGLTHSFSGDPADWYWVGEHDVFTENIIIQAGSAASAVFGASKFAVLAGELNEMSSVIARFVPTIESRDLTALNMGKVIGLDLIAGLYTGINDAGSSIKKFVNTAYGSPIDFLNYAAVGGKTNLATAMLSSYLSPDQINKVTVNQQFFNNLLEKKQNIETSMFDGNVAVSQAFGITSDFIKLKQAKSNDPLYLTEDHPAIDVAGKGTAIKTPGGGFWTYEGTNAYNAIFSLYGGDLRMRINHVNTAAITHKTDTIIGAAGQSIKLLDYPDKLYGTGSGTHVHVEYTLNLPYNGKYERQYVSPNTLLPNTDYFDYSLRYYDKDKKLIRSTKYNRGF
jgi:exonuclease VII small subunit